MFDNKLLPYYVVETMGHLPGVAGLFIAGIFSGSLSTVSSALNSLAAVTMQDFLIVISSFVVNVLPFTQIDDLSIFLQPCCFKNTADTRLAWYSQLVALTFGGLSLAIAFVAEYLGGVLQASLTIFGVVGGQLLALFTILIFYIHSILLH